MDNPGLHLYQELVSAIDEAKVVDLQVSANLMKVTNLSGTTTDVNGVHI